ncbi:hypothetical protein EYC80_007566 [Monilinia laxa]|uniref:Uncharacterized protein n=1 Tax=Monilinia laxa TaxID=61186 RepID=A0A5N6JWB3_MONLA|nr:hypothetical protein EYC80_007566 [Monilinia laxa]
MPIVLVVLYWKWYHQSMRSYLSKQRLYIKLAKTKCIPKNQAITPHSQPTALYALAAAWFGLTFFPSLLYLTRGGGRRLRLPTRDRTL